VAITNATWWFFSAGADFKAFQIASPHQRTSCPGGSLPRLGRISLHLNSVLIIDYGMSTL
jgi:hypothetical protein